MLLLLPYLMVDKGLMNRFFNLCSSLITVVIGFVCKGKMLEGLEVSIQNVISNSALTQNCSMSFTFQFGYFVSFKNQRDRIKHRGEN